MMPTHVEASWNGHSSVRLIRLILMNNKVRDDVLQNLLTRVNIRADSYHVMWRVRQTNNKPQTNNRIFHRNSRRREGLLSPVFMDVFLFLGILSVGC